MALGNYVGLVGRLTADPEIKVTQNNHKVCSFSIARNRPKKNKDDATVADFFNCVAWNATAELITKYFIKGDAIGVEGSLSTRDYETKDGQKRRVTEVLVNGIDFTCCQHKSKDSSSNKETSEKSTTPALKQDDYEVMTSDDELPF